MNDPYMNTNCCVDRLYREWKKHPKLIIAVDFDDTVFPFHGENANYDRIFSVLKECQVLGFYIVLWTASAPERYEMMKEYMDKRGINISSINKNPIPLPFGNNGKIYYNLLLDDRAGLAQAYATLVILIDRIKKEKASQISV